MTTEIIDLIERFKLYRHSHPNLSQCWISYLGLKKRHYAKKMIDQCNSVLAVLENGYSDWSENDILRVLLYKRSLQA
jgi:hypothetical protein